MAQKLDQVILVGHSFGGLFIRAALEECERAKRVRRVLTFGTPYLGAPKAIFPLVKGKEAPGFSPINLLLLGGGNALKEFAKNLTGNYWLYPSTPYGPWLTVNGRRLNQAGVADFVQAQGGSTAALGRATDAHATLDGFKASLPTGCASTGP